MTKLDDLEQLLDAHWKPGTATIVADSDLRDLIAVYKIERHRQAHGCPDPFACPDFHVSLKATAKKALARLEA